MADDSTPLPAPQDRADPTPHSSLRERADRILATVETVRFLLGPTKGPDFNTDCAALIRDLLKELEVAAPARAHQEETKEENDEGVSRVDGECLSEATGTPRKPPTGEQ